MAHYLVTGGAGFIGSNIGWALVRRGERVRVLDNLSEGSLKNLSGVLDRIEFIHGDLRDREAVSRAVEGIDYVLHQGGLRAVPRSVVDPLSTHEVNMTGTLNLLEAARQAKVSRVVFASSSSIYGGVLEAVQDETQVPAPVSPYAVSKIAGEYYCSVYTNTFGLETVSLRYFNVFGPRQDPASEYAMVIPRFILAALRDQPLEIHWDGRQSRDFIYVDNVVEFNLKAATAPGIAGEVFNVGSGQSYSMIEVKQALEKVLGKKLESYHTERRAGDVRFTRADISKAEKLLGYRIAVNFEEGLRRTVEYFKGLEGA
jgi:UDP-glucose 4-epimerase